MLRDRDICLAAQQLVAFDILLRDRRFKDRNIAELFQFDQIRRRVTAVEKRRVEIEVDFEMRGQGLGQLPALHDQVEPRPRLALE